MTDILIERSERPERSAVDGLDRIGLALADPTRRSVLLELLAGPARPSQLADRLDVSRTNLSNHLACLRGCGLVLVERRGRHLDYRLVDERLAEVLRMLVDVASALPICEDHRP